MKLKLLFLLLFAGLLVGHAQINSVAIVGSAVGGWPGEPNNPGPVDINQFTQVDNENWVIENLTVAVGPCKIRANNVWNGAGFEWAGAYPAAIGTSAGDILVPIAGIYTVTLNTTTGVYNFQNTDPLPIIQLIGSAISNGTPITLTPSGTDLFTANDITLIDGLAQFQIEQNNNVSIFGENQFPTGILTRASNNIPITAATYSSISVNIATGEYSFVTASVNPIITISGSAIGGTSNAVTMSTNDGVTYYCTNLPTTQGELVFNINTPLTYTYGNSNFPTGVATLNGSPVLVPSGTWAVTFNTLTKTYNFSEIAAITSVAIVGSAVGGWPGEPSNPGPYDANQMTTTDGENWIIENLTIAVGPCKFRANNIWNGPGFEWAGAYPTATGTSAGDIYIPVEGIYTVTLNTTTGIYNFQTDATLPNVQLIGSAVTSGNPITLTPSGTDIFTATDITLVDGNAQFSIEGNIFGENQFPTGTLTGATNNIPVIAATYSSISVNIATGDYSFVFAPIPVNSYVTISGNAIGGANTDVDMTTNDGVLFYYPNLSTTQGEVLFNINTTVTESYGNSNFPTGIATLNGNAVLIPSGTWNVTFNALTKAYNFSGTQGNPIISIVGDGAGGWPGSPENPGPVDIHQMVTEDGINYTLYALTVTEGSVKFREDNNWTLNWGNAAFPSGIGTQGGENITITTAGTYTVTFNRLTGEYNFGTPNRIAIVGTGAGGWPTAAIGEVDAHQLTSTDGIHFRLDDMELTDGEVKFRQNNSWEVFWGGTSLNGTLILFGPAIQTTAGTYSINLNRLTGNYSLATNHPTRSDFKIYPNPTQNIWNFTAAKEAIEAIQIFDALGKNILTTTPKDTSAILDASGLPSGLYFAKITTANATETVKLMKN